MYFHKLLSGALVILSSILFVKTVPGVTAASFQITYARCTLEAPVIFSRYTQRALFKVPSMSIAISSKHVILLNFRGFRHLL